jgi:hypothetical protein
MNTMKTWVKLIYCNCEFTVILSTNSGLCSSLTACRSFYSSCLYCNFRWKCLCYVCMYVCMYIIQANVNLILNISNYFKYLFYIFRLIHNFNSNKGITQVTLKLNKQMLTSESDIPQVT